MQTGILDGVRGLAALYVMLAHARILLFVGWSSAAIIAAPKVARAAADLTDFAHAAVLAFFLVSGYAIHFRPAQELAQGKLALTWRRYAISRVRRLYPPLCTALVLTLVCDQIGARLFAPAYAASQPGMTAYVSSVHAETLPAFIGCLLFVQGWLTPIFGTNGPLWSLAFEGFFYAAYPLVLLANRRLGPTRCLALFTVVGGAAGFAILRGAQVADHHTHQYELMAQAGGALALLLYWPAWVAGAFLADARAERVKLPDRIWHIGGAASVLVLAALFARLELQHQHGSPLLYDPIWVAGIFGLLGWLVVARHGRRTGRWLPRLSQPLLAVGAMSYSLYVVHMPILSLVSAVWFRSRATMPTTPWLAATGAGAALAIAAVVYQVAERPFLSARRRNLLAVPATPSQPALSDQEALAVTP